MSRFPPKRKAQGILVDTPRASKQPRVDAFFFAVPRDDGQTRKQTQSQNDSQSGRHTVNQHLNQSQSESLRSPFFKTGPNQNGGSQPAKPALGNKNNTSFLSFKKKKPTGPTLSDEQNAVLRMVVDEGRSIFFTGSAGLFSSSSCHPPSSPFVFFFLFRAFRANRNVH